ncbi:MAG: ABC transporter permease [Sphingomonadaceae bacterium]|uniref:ABC transporter permease n=1 Tax=Thermaurantiacus sp. TaxID=2820283 RepID=UPI00298F2CC9|nr:FtsX-like permease family protein [Thermaurantiacus sp.]MCS6987346.1 ABC transporter permease [Sphingomonadaceae bacterium]MDW8414567.1 FtsX-like permease family protein [Thermaurantiacus sp.]
MWSLALAYLRDRWGATLLNVLLVALSVAGLVLLLLLASRVEDRFARDAAGIDLVVGAEGSPLQLILSAVYHLDIPTGNIPLATLEALRRDPGVARVVPLALGDSFRGFRIVGTEPGFLALHGSRLAEGRMFAQPMEAVLGAEVARTTGARLGQRFVGSHGLDDAGGDMSHAHTPFEVVGLLAPTGAVVDRLILTPVESVWQVHDIPVPGAASPEGTPSGHGADAERHDHAPGEAHDHALDAAPFPLRAERSPAEAGPTRGAVASPPPEVTALLVTYRSPAAAIRLPAAIDRQPGLQAAVPARETARFLALFDAAIAGARLFGWALVVVGAVSIFVVLLAAARAREGDLALLRAMGASRGQLAATVVMEGLVTAALGAALGAVLGHALVAVAAARFRALEAIGLHGLMFHPGEIAIMGGALVLGVLAALVPAWRVLRTDLAAILARAA